MTEIKQEDIEGYIDAIAEPIFKQKGWRNLEPIKLGILRVTLIARYRSGELDKPTYNTLDNTLKEQIGIEVKN